MAFLVVLSLLCLQAASAWGCAFPGGACTEKVCNSLDTTKFNAILLKDKFKADNESTKASFSALESDRLGYYFDEYNPEFKPYNKDKNADRDGVPMVNYFEMRNSLGAFQDSGVTMADCCSLCAAEPGCSMWLLNPYVKNSAFTGTGDCSFLLQSEKGETWTFNKVNDNCLKETPVYKDKSVKAYFYGGLCNSKIEDDPHFVGARGTRFDFNGQLDKSYCLMSDSNLHINALLRGYEAPRAGEVGLRSWMKELGFLWTGEDGVRHTLRLVARAGKQQQRGTGFLAKVELDGESLSIPAVEGAALVQGDVSLTFEGVGKVNVFDLDNFQLKIGDLLELHLALRVAHPKLQTPEDAEVHFNMRIDGLRPTESIHGVLGQTYRGTSSQTVKAIKYSALTHILGAPVQADGSSGKGFLEGEPQDYTTSSVTAADCKFSAFAA